MKKNQNTCSFENTIQSEEIGKNINYFNCLLQKKNLISIFQKVIAIMHPPQKDLLQLKFHYPLARFLHGS